VKAWAGLVRPSRLLGCWPYHSSGTRLTRDISDFRSNQPDWVTGDRANCIREVSDG
jgi:hypothetical protein